MTFTLLNIPGLFGLSIDVYFILSVIVVPTFFFWKWILKKFIKTDKTRRITTLAATLIMTPLIYAALILLLIYWITYTPASGFDKSKWMMGKQGRFEMAGDIISSKMLISRDSNEVKQILGEPSSGSNRTWRSDTINIWTYDMGWGGGGLGFMFHVLYIKFNKEHVVNVKHVKVHG
jgi:hypothetical protein